MVINEQIIGNWRSDGKPTVTVIIIGADAFQEGSSHIVAVGQFSTFGNGDAAAILKGNVTYIGNTFDDGRSGNDDITAPLGKTVAPVFLIVPKPLMDKGGLYKRGSDIDISGRHDENIGAFHVRQDGRAVDHE